MRFVIVFCAVLLQAAFARADLVYLIGNSYTWDTVPTKLDGTVEYHVDCSKTLDYIYHNSGAPCITSSTLWPAALVSTQYDYLSVQPYYGNLDDDAAAISAWWQMQPSATLVIHEGWASYPKHETEFHDPNLTDAQGRANHNPAYIAALIDRLRDTPGNPQGEIRNTQSTELIEKIYHDIDNGVGPYSQLSDIYRDTFHMSYVDGRYLMHNAMRIALDQPLSITGFESIDPAHRAYLDSVLAYVTAVPESGWVPSTAALVVVSVLFLQSRRLRLWPVQR